MQSDEDRRVSVPPPIKVIVLGASNSGKTSLRARFIHGRFSSAYRASVGADFETVHVTSQGGQRFQLSVWDTAGQERFKALSAPFYRGSDAVLLCYSATDPKSLQAIKSVRSLAPLRRTDSVARYCRSWYDEFVERCPVPEDERWRYCFVGLRLKDDLSTAEGSTIEEADALFKEILPPSVRSGNGNGESKVDSEERPARMTIQVGSGMTMTRSETHKSFRTAHHSIYHTPDSSLSSSTIKPRVAEEECEDDFDPMLASSPPPLPPDGLPTAAHYEAPLSSLLPPPTPPKLPEEPIPNGHLHPVAPERVESVTITRDYAQDGIKHFAVSAKEDRGIREVFEHVVERVVWKRALIEDEQRRDSWVQREREQAFRLDGPVNKKSSWRSRCC